MARKRKAPKQSGYTHCGCRDCFEIVVSDDMARPDFCDDCQTAGCVPGASCRVERAEDDGYDDEPSDAGGL